MAAAQDIDVLDADILALAAATTPAVTVTAPDAFNVAHCRLASRGAMETLVVICNIAEVLAAFPDQLVFAQVLARGPSACCRRW